MNTLLLNTGRLATVVFLLLVPLAVPYWTALAPHDPSRYAQIVLGVFCALACLRRGGVGPLGGPRTRVGWGLLTVAVVLAGLSTVLADEPVWAARELALWTAMGVIACFVAGDEQAVTWLAPTVVYATLAYNALVLGAVTVQMLHGVMIGALDLSIGYNNARFLNHVQAVALPLIAALAVQPAGGVRKAPVWAALVTGFVLVFATGGRATAGAVVAAALLAWLWIGRAARPAAGRLALSLAVGYLVYVAVFRWLPGALGMVPDTEGLIQRLDSTASIELRFFLWRLALDYITASPWLGVGPMHYAHFPNPEAAHPHNIYLQIAAEWGLPLLMLLGGVLLVGLWRWGRAVRTAASGHERYSRWGAGLLIVVLSMLADGMASGNFVMPVSQVWIGVAIGLVWQWHAAAREGSGVVSGEAGAPGSARRRRAARVAQWVSLGLLLWALGVNTLEWPQLPAQIEASRALGPLLRFNPRYWSTGWF